MSKAILITVRNGSSRLKNKALLKINNVTVIEYIIKRMLHSKGADKIILCTTENPKDDVLCDIAERNNILFFRGDEEDKLERWNGACKHYGIEYFVTCDGDDLFCDTELIDKAFEQYNTSNHDFLRCDGITGSGNGIFDHGIKASALHKVCEIKDTKNTEMMWVYFTDTNLFRVQNLTDVPKSYFRDDIRMTLDYPEDLLFFKKIINYFGVNNHLPLSDIINYINLNPSVAKLNIQRQKEWKDNQVKNTKLILKKS